MEEPQHNIDEMFRQSLGDYREAPPPAAWDGVVSRLDEDASRRGLLRYWPWIGLVLLLLCGGSWYAMNYTKQSRQDPERLSETSRQDPGARPGDATAGAAAGTAAQTASSVQGRHHTGTPEPAAHPHPAAYPPSPSPASAAAMHEAGPAATRPAASRRRYGAQEAPPVAIVHGHIAPHPGAGSFDTGADTGTPAASGEPRRLAGGIRTGTPAHEKSTPAQRVPAPQPAEGRLVAAPAVARQSPTPAPAGRAARQPGGQQATGEQTPPQAAAVSAHPGGTGAGTAPAVPVIAGSRPAEITAVQPAPPPSPAPAAPDGPHRTAQGAAAPPAGAEPRPAAAIPQPGATALMPAASVGPVPAPAAPGSTPTPDRPAVPGKGPRPGVADSQPPPRPGEAGTAPADRQQSSPEGGRAAGAPGGDAGLQAGADQLPEERRRRKPGFTLDLLGGYELALQKPAPATGAGVLRFSWRLGRQLSLGVQPAYRFGNLASQQLSGTQAYGNVRPVQVDTIIVPDTLTGPTYHYFVRQSYDSIRVPPVDAGGRFWSVELPLVLYYEPGRWRFYGGPSFHFGGKISTTATGTVQTFTVNRADSFQTRIPAPASRFDNYFGTSALEPYSNYKAPQAGDLAGVRMGYILGLGYQWNGLMLEASLHQQLTGFSQVASELRKIYNSPSIRISVGYRILGRKSAGRRKAPEKALNQRL